MYDPTRRKLLALLSLAPAVSLAGGFLGDSSPAVASSFDVRLSPRERIRRRYFPNVKLQTQDGKTVNFYDDLIKDKVVTINFFYAKCKGICPTVNANLAKVQTILGDSVGREIFMNSISLKPEADTPAVLKGYAEAYGAKPGWTFLTGRPDDIELLRRSLGFTNLDPVLDKDKSQHIGNIRYGNEPLMFWAACPGMDRPEFIAKSISWVMRKV